MPARAPALPGGKRLGAESGGVDRGRRRRHDCGRMRGIFPFPGLVVVALACVFAGAEGVVDTPGRAQPEHARGGVVAASASPPLPVLIGRAHVIDGDSLSVAGEQVRLFGIDAPELDQQCRDAAGRTYACGRAVTDALRERIGNSRVRCELQPERDRYGRAIGVCYGNATELNAWMAAQGFALALPHVSRRYTGEEAAARAARRGLWRGAFVRPGAWRNGERLR